MVHLNLNYFNTIQGPQIFHTYPEDADENTVQSVANLLNIGELIKQKFFIYEGGEFKTVSQYFEIPSAWARGKKEMLLVSIILPSDYTIENKDPIRSILNQIEAEINQIENGYMAFYEYDYSKVEEHEDEIEDLAQELRNLIENYTKEAKIALKEAKKISLEQIKEVYQQKTLSRYVIDDGFLNYLFEIEQNTTPFVRFADFLDSGIFVFTSRNCIEVLQMSDAIREIIKNYVGNRKIAQEEIDALKEGVDPRRLPSDAKISLLAFIKYLKKVNPGEELTIVTPDHNYLNFVQDYFPELRVLPPSSFFLEILNNIENKETRDYYENLRKKLTNYELEKAVVGQSTSASSEQLNWLLEKAISVASQTVIPISSLEGRPEAGIEEKELALINQFIAGKPILDSDFELIKDYEESLIAVVKAQESLLEIQEDFTKGELASAQAKIFKTTKKLMDSFLLSSATLSEKVKRHQIQNLIGNFIANFEFLAALFHLNLRQLEQAIERFYLAASFSSIAEQNKKVLISIYLKSITYLFNGSYQDAIHDFAITAQLGARFSPLLGAGFHIMGTGGKAISQSLAGMADSAKETIKETTKLIHNHERDALMMFHEFGDIFYMMGKSEIAIHLYNEALQLAIFVGDNQLAGDIYNKVERSFYAVGSYHTPLSAGVAQLIDRVLTLNDEETIEQYNLQIAKLGDINKKLFFESFPYITDEWVPGEQLDETLFKWFDLLQVVVETKYRKVKNRKRKTTYTALYCYQKELGGIIIHVPGILDLKIKDIPVIYEIALQPENTEYKIVDTSKEQKQNYYARAIIQTKSRKSINFRKVVPEIFGKFFED